MHKFLFSVVALTLIGCASTPALNYDSIKTNVSFPEIGKETEVALGEDMLRQGYYTDVDGVEFSEENNIRGYKLMPGFYPQISEDKKYTYHSYKMTPSSDGYGYLLQPKTILGITVAYPESIRASKTKQETCIINGGLALPVCDTQIPFKRTRHPSLSERDLQQTLIYSGRVGDRIKIGYRETSESYARPAFSNEAEYDLSASDEIAYRGARIKVLSADNQKIRYVVLSNFNTN
jgi:hypothetical protein